MDNYEREFQLILHAGDARSKAMLATEEARDGNFDLAEKLVAEAKESFKQAHKSQTSLIQAEAKGEKTELNILLIHAQDHLSIALTSMDNAQEFISIYKVLHHNKLI
ncbi:PTS lactose/cellobiose transporter subunit IIA [Alkalibacterium sp. s-m-22]